MATQINSTTFDQNDAKYHVCCGSVHIKVCSEFPSFTAVTNKYIYISFFYLFLKIYIPRYCLDLDASSPLVSLHRNIYIFYIYI